jgi:hypothetical protein
MSRSPQEDIIAALLARLGGDVTITPKELYDAADLDLTRTDDPISRSLRFTAKPPPLTLVGELVNGDTLEIETHGNTRQH